MFVRRHSRALLSVALLLAMAVRVYAAPTCSTAQLKAAACCATHCNHQRGAPRPDDCCQVVSSANDAALLTSSLALHPIVAVHSLPLAPLPLSHVISASFALGVEYPGDGPPLFLQLRSLRL
jgi:hypothetical protein